jgi:hypothetical protein
MSLKGSMGQSARDFISYAVGLGVDEIRGASGVSRKLLFGSDSDVF